MRILDRYVLQKFFLPFVYCVLGFIAIWFIFDLSDNLPDFLQGKVGFDILAQYYKSQIPEIIVVSLPIGGLLALLYSLTAMSRSNEIISMLGAGVSVTRVLVPLMLVGLLLVAITGYGQEEDKRRSQEAGFDRHLVKPVAVRELLRLIDTEQVSTTVPGSPLG